MKFNHTAHRKLWLWLAEDASRNKEDWPEWEYNGGTIPKVENNCVACAYAHELYKISGSAFVCHDCPLEWPNGGVCWERGNLFKLWCDSGEELSRAFAVEIANVPVKYGVDYI